MQILVIYNNDGLESFLFEAAHPMAKICKRLSNVEVNVTDLSEKQEEALDKWMQWHSKHRLNSEFRIDLPYKTTDSVEILTFSFPP